MSKPKFFRDPVHVQVRYEDVDLAAAIPASSDAGRSSWLSRKIIDSSNFQRLRFIRQNGLANLVFHGAEHSRFTHSLGVSHLAGEMFDRIVRNTGELDMPETRLLVVTAGLLHDIGHGPFSHTLEEILASSNVAFDHEAMTVRLIEEEGSEINQILRQVDSALPGKLAPFFDKSRRTSDHWSYRVVSSQLDADRLDYLLRDSMYAGIKGHGFDIARLLDLLYHHENKIAVERGAIEAIEAYLVTLDQMYRAIYYHHAVRSANFIMTSALRRAFELFKGGQDWVFPDVFGDEGHPLRSLFEHGEKVPLSTYVRLGEQHVWVMLDVWSKSSDRVLSDLSARILGRRLFKSMTLSFVNDYQKTHELIERAKEKALDLYDWLDEKTVDYYVGMDAPERTSYKRYDWRPESREESIWMIGDDRSACPIEDERDSRLVVALKDTRYFPRLIMPGAVRRAL